MSERATRLVEGDVRGGSGLPKALPATTVGKGTPRGPAAQAAGAQRRSQGEGASCRTPASGGAATGERRRRRLGDDLSLAGPAPTLVNLTGPEDDDEDV